MKDLPLGKKTAYKDQYDASLLYPIDRGVTRNTIGITTPLPFKGYDIWNCYEFSWLGISGKPEVRVIELIVPAYSKNIIEAKSLKLYLNSFNNTKFSNEAEIVKLIENDISSAIEAPIYLKIQNLDSYLNSPLSSFNGTCLDLINVKINQYTIDQNLLMLAEENTVVQETVYTNLLKSNCLVTQQPDWGSIEVSYTGPKIDHSSLLKYFISFRNQTEFVESCVERVFMDIMNKCNTQELTVYARYTRRGGIDTNPIRSTRDLNVTELKNLRHIRQ